MTKKDTYLARMSKTQYAFTQLLHTSKSNIPATHRRDAQHEPFYVVIGSCMLQREQHGSKRHFWLIDGLNLSSLYALVNDIHIYTYIYIYIYKVVYMHKYTHMYTYVCTYIHKYAYI